MIKYLTTLFAAVILLSCAEDIPSYVVVHGVIDNNNSETVRVYGSELDANIDIDENATFRDTLTIEQEGYFTMRIGRESTSIYLTKGSDLGITVNMPEFDETIVYTGNLAAENNYLAAKYLQSEQEKSFSEVYKMNEEDFLKEINFNKEQYLKLLNGTENLSEKFREQELKELEYEMVSNLENFKGYYIYLTSDKTFEVSEGFYDLLKDIDYTDTTEYRRSQGYRRMLLTHYGRMADENSNEEGYNKTVKFLSLVHKNLPKGYTKDGLMYDFLKYNLRADEFLEKAYTIFKEANSNADNLTEVSSRYDLLNTIVPGKKSPQFDYENYEGGTTSLNDLKGKYVYLDIWATWCGPCKREIPHLKKIEKDYEDKNIAIVSISIDVKNDYDKWRAMVEEKELGGIQLYADNDWSSKFIKDYGIKGIPRFILLDKEGNIITSDAPRPSNTDLRALFDSLEM
jgi:thiol-disulfide isomerase/thioredoxin